MNSFICKKNLMPCPTPGMCAPFDGCPGVDIDTGKKLVAENDRLFKLLERMVNQMLPVEEMKDLPGYSRVLTAETLLAERDQLKADNEALKAKLSECAEFIDNAPGDYAEIEGLRKDAERYRWLRAQSYYAHVQVMEKDGSMPFVYGDELDRTVDFGLLAEPLA